MPVISIFYGIIVLMYYFDNRRHQQPHIHANTVMKKPSSQYLTAKSLRARCERRSLKLVQAWVELHRDELMADWTLAVNGQPIFKIEPLR
jgi:hypothetical protein